MAKTAEAPKDYRQSKRQEINILRTQLENERATFLSQWRELGEYIKPRRPRFTVTDTNKGDRRWNKIIDSTATFSANVLQSGMMSGITHPARPWFRLTTADAKLSDVASIKDWLEDVTQAMRGVFARSNLYKTLPIIYGDMGVFGTSAMLIEEDMEKVVRFSALPIGSYCISVNNRGKIDTYHREFQMTVRNLVTEYGTDFPGQEIQWDRFTDSVKNAWENGNRETWVTVCHLIRPNPDYDAKKKLSKFKRYESLTYEKGAMNTQSREFSTSKDENKFLREKGYDYFPVLCPRWHVTGEDSYATDCPGMTALGDIKALQVLQKLKGNAIEKGIKPPLIGGPGMRNARVSHIPGDISWVKETGDEKLRSMYEVRFEVAEVGEEIKEHQNRIRRAFHEDLFLMISNDERAQPPTAEEIVERRSEKMVALGPVYEQLNEDAFDDLIDITFALMLRQDRIPPPPRELQGQELRVEYVSIMAQAQKSLAVGGIERFAGFVTNFAAQTQDPSVMDKVSKDRLVEEHATSLGVNPKIILSDDEANQIRQSRAQAQKAQMDAEIANQQASAVKNLSETNLEGDTALKRLVEMGQAGSPLPVN